MLQLAAAALLVAVHHEHHRSPRAPNGVRFGGGHHLDAARVQVARGELRSPRRRHVLGRRGRKAFLLIGKDGAAGFGGVERRRAGRPQRTAGDAEEGAHWELGVAAKVQMHHAARQDVGGSSGSRRHGCNREEDYVV